MSSTGTIKKFFEDKGFGFITPDDGSEDVFAHVKECPDLDGAQPGDAVNYDTKYDDRKGGTTSSPSSWLCRTLPMAETTGSQNKQAE